MTKRSSYKIKKAILEKVREKPATYADLERKINTGYRTVKNNCEELKDFGHIDIQKSIHPANKKESNVVNITETGMKFLLKQGKNKLKN